MMKVTVCFGSVRVVVPCGNGDIPVRDLINQATLRFKKASGKPADSWVAVHHVQSHEGGILDPDDRLGDVVDDREQIVASYEDGEGVHHGGGDGASGSSVGTGSPDLFQSDRRYSRNDIEVTGALPAAAALQVRRGSEPALNQLLPPGAPRADARPPPPADPCKRWSATPIVVDRPPKDPRERDGCSNGYLSPGGGERSAFTRFARDGSSRLSMQFSGDAHWADAADRLAAHQSKSLPRERRRKEPLGEANSPPARLPDSDPEDRPGVDSAEYVVISNDGEPLGIHVVPDYDALGEETGILVQGVEPRGKVARCARLAVSDRIVEINGRNLLNMPFHRVQEIFKDALRSPELRLRVLRRSATGLKRRPPAPIYPRSHAPADKENQAMVEGGERAVGRASKLATVSPTKKLSPGHQAARGATGLLAANTRRIGRKMELELAKGPHGLGFSITTRDNPAGGNCPIYVKNILPKGAAVRDGRLRPGDRLLEVDGVEMTGKTQAEAVSVLRNAAPGSKVRIVVSRQEDTSSPKLPRPIQVDSDETDGALLQADTHSDEHVQESSAEKSPDDVPVLPWKHREVLTFDIPVHDSEKAGLGVSVKGKTSASHGSSSVVDLGIFVKSVLHGGAASRDGRLRTNDQLLNVNGISLLGQSNSDAMETLRQAMLYTEGPVPGVISLTVARRAGPSGRDSASSILSGSSGTETFGEGKFDNSGNSETSDNTVIFLPSAAMKTPPASDHSGEGRNPVIDRLTGQHAGQNAFRNQSYYQATREVWNTTVPISGGPGSCGPLTSPTVNLPPEEMALIEEERCPQPAPQLPGHRPTRDAQPGRGQPPPSDHSGSSHGADATYASQLSLEDHPDGFSRDAFGRQSMSEKRHAALDAKNTDTYQRNKKLREERDRQKSSSQLQPSKSSTNSASVVGTKEHAAMGLRCNSVESVVSMSRTHAESNRPRNEFGPSLGMKKSSSLESLQTVMQEMQEDCEVYRNMQGAVRSVRGRGCNESFRAAVDRSYDAPLAELRSRLEMETLAEEDGYGAATDGAGRSFGGSRGCPRQSSLNAILDAKGKSAKKKPSLLKGIGSMFRFGKQRKAPGEMGAEGEAEEREAARRAAQDEQQRIREQYHRLMLRQKELELQEGGPPSQTRTERIHQLRAQHQQRHAERRGQYPRDDQEERYEQVIRQRLDQPHARTASYDLYGEMARPGSRVAISDPNKFSHYVNYEEIQQHLNRRQQHYHSQRQNSSSGRETNQRPVSSFFEYESVQNAMRSDANSNSLPRPAPPSQDSGASGGGPTFQQHAAPSQSQRGVSYANRGRHRGPFVTHVTIGHGHPLPGSKV
ncbi:partitioning defective 3 homolog B isoform X3 [Bacillus rossius redtenbacheri]|uniref:partitioning defective 3 homolog B isoform X3 n=1 Tax=Bacillus rossius redtenbacheri TaxID=93214 RepID=UPI002FDCF7DE